MLEVGPYDDGNDEPYNRDIEESEGGGTALQADADGSHSNGDIDHSNEPCGGTHAEALKSMKVNCQT